MTKPPSGGRGSDERSEDRRVVPWASNRRVIAALLVTALGLWAMVQMRSLVAMIAIAFFFSLALEPAVRWLVRRFGWSRTSSVGVAYLGIAVFIVGMVVVLIPAIGEFARSISEQGSQWVDSLNEWTEEVLAITLFDSQAAPTSAAGAEEFIGG